MINKKILKIFLTDWVITLLMYVSGYIISGIKSSESLDIVSYLSGSVEKQKNYLVFLNIFTYFFISLCTVMLISFFVNKNIVKASRREFIYSQALYLISIVVVILSLLFLI